jgi:uncharacterized glyoxalase superfamily protein PhnB
MDLTVRFYEQGFDALVTFEVPKPEDHPWMKILDLGGRAALNVFEVPADEIIGDRRRQGGRGATDHYALAVDSYATLETLTERLAAAGAQEVGDIQRLGDEWSLFKLAVGAGESKVIDFTTVCVAHLAGVAGADNE